MLRPRTLVLIGVVAAGVVTVVRHIRDAAAPTGASGGSLMGNAVAYDVLTGLALGPLFRHIAADVAAVAPDGARVLEVGCGPGHLSARLAREHGLDVTGVDLDPAMIERARANTGSANDATARRPSFLVGDVTSLACPDESFDLVVSTLSMHHWTDPTAGLVEIGRVLRTGGRALVWDFLPGVWPLHTHLSDPVEHIDDSPLRVVSATPWRWPWRFKLVRRIELARVEHSPP